jgi:hypothetical protein
MMKDRQRVAIFDRDIVVPKDDRDRWLAEGFKELGASSYAAEPQERDKSIKECRARGVDSDAVLEVLFQRSNIVKYWLRDYRDQEEIEAWRAAFQTAAQRIAEPLLDFDWSCLIGLAPIRGTAQLMNAKLSDDVSLAPFKFEVCPHRIIEYGTNPMSPHSSQVMISWPVHLSGTARGRDWWAATRKATYDIRQACALLSLAYDQCWIPRRQPQDPNMSEFQFPVTEKFVEEIHGSENYEDLSPLPQVPWFDGAIQNLQDDQRLSDALIAFHESMILAPNHPSVAVVLLVAAIESIGVKYGELERCECGKSELGYADRFRAMLRKVLYPAEARKVARVYENRSGTAHAGTLYGHDRRLGLGGPSSIFSVDPEHEFSSDLIFALRKACRRLLELELGGRRTWTLSKDDMPGGLVAATVLVSDITIGEPSTSSTEEDS